MKIVCHREALLSGVSIAANVTPARSPKPILAGIRLSARDGQVVALATDLEVAVCSRIQEVIIDREGDIVVSAQTLVEILRSVEGHEVTLDSDGRYCEIRSEDAEYKLVTDDPEEFPEIGRGPVDGVSVPRAFIEEMFARTGFAAAKDIGRYAINGVLVEIGDGSIRFVATDGRRLSIATRDLPDVAKDVRQRAIIPAKGIHECLRGSDGSSTVKVLVEEDRVVFSSERADITTKPVEGEYPDYDRVIPGEHTGRAVLPRDKLLAALRKVSVMAGEDMRQVKIEVEDRAINISSQVEGRGEAKTQVEADTSGTLGLEVDYNPDYVIEFLKALPAEEVAFEFRDANGASIFRLDGSDDRYVVMPITTS